MWIDADSPLPGTEVHHVDSDHVGAKFKVVVGHCGASDSTPGHVLFMGDGWANFGTAVETIRLLRLTQSVPPMLVVAVDPVAADPEQGFELRARDFTPTVDPASSERLMGGADRFAGFMRDELQPWVARRFGVDPGDSMFFGDSYGGLFATHVLLSQPTLFRRYGIGSPSLWWHEGVMFEREAAYAANHDDLSARAYFSVGGLETVDGRRRFIDQLPPEMRAAAAKEDADDPPLDMVAAMQRMVAALAGRNYKSLVLESEVLPGEYHETAPPLNLSRAIRYLFGAPL